MVETDVNLKSQHERELSQDVTLKGEVISSPTVHRSKHGKGDKRHTEVWLNFKMQISLGDLKIERSIICRPNISRAQEDGARIDVKERDKIMVTFLASNLVGKPETQKVRASKIIVLTR